ncbi:hypothetical protein INT45_003595 [Circinella minor]|uniref:Kelch repeat-containing protein n=1 Tax=Circinella minor TaxID=1195481 RepID=A0A8H7RWJ4_9FUNG|nr:hypothetical protein INT45_003595 [Circinella minor]
MKRSSIAALLGFVPLTFATRPSVPRLGQDSDDNDEKAKTHADHYVLDIGSMNQVDDSALENWRQLSDSPMGPNAHFAIAPLSSEGYLVHGGWGPHDQHTYLLNQTWIFHTNSERWETIASNVSRLDLIAKMPSVLGSNGRIWIWGGEMESNQPRLLLQQNIQFPRGAYTRVGHSAVLARDGLNIFYFGGMNAKTENRDMDDDHGGFRNAPMNDVLVFNTVNKAWSRRTSTGDVVPSPRAFHTTNLVPNSDNILLYGGRQFGTVLPVKDYIYRFNTESNQWTEINLSQAGAGPRWGHSGTTVLHNDRSLFILFGANSQGAPTNDFYILDVNDMNWQGRSSGDDGSGTNAGNGNIYGKSSSNLDGGQIAGIVIGCLAAAVITGSIVLSLYRRRKRQQELYETYGNNPPDNEDEAIFSNLGVVGTVPPPVPPKNNYITRFFQKPDEPSVNDIVPQVKENKPDTRD